MKDRLAARHRGHRHRSSLLKRQARERLRQSDRQIAASDAALHAALTADSALQARFAILVSIPEAIALAMPSEMPELGAIEHKGVASLAGLAPIARDSGQRSGERFFRGERPSAPGALDAGPARCPLQRSDGGETPRPPGRWKTTQGGANRHHRKRIILANALIPDGGTWPPRLA
jgi:transposase